MKLLQTDEPISKRFAEAIVKVLALCYSWRLYICTEIFGRFSFNDCCN